MLDEGEIVEDDADAAYGIGPRQEFHRIQVSNEGAKVKSGKDIGKIRRRWMMAESVGYCIGVFWCL